MMLKLIALTMMCDANRSFVMHWPGLNTTFDWDGIHHDYDHHGLSHRNGNGQAGGTCVSGVLDMLRDIDRWYAGRYLQLISLIDSISEGEGTMLDNSAVAWIPELADGNIHALDNLPIVIAGSAGGYLKTGASVNVFGPEVGTGDSLGSCATDRITFSGPLGGGIEGAPLNKLYVTLLNALGATNGGAPFTEFGQADTNDVSAGITDPGEFTELKA